jgi:hypothetical protein
MPNPPKVSDPSVQVQAFVLTGIPHRGLSPGAARLAMDLDEQPVASHGLSWAGGCGFAGHAVNPSMGARSRHPWRSTVPQTRPRRPSTVRRWPWEIKGRVRCFSCVTGRCIVRCSRLATDPTAASHNARSTAVGSVARRLPANHPHAVTHYPRTKSLLHFPMATNPLSKVGRGGFAGLSKTWMFLPSLHGRIHGVSRKPAPSRQTRDRVITGFPHECMKHRAAPGAQ